VQQEHRTIHNSTPEKEAQPAAAATPIDPATVATVSGTVKFDGTAPKASKIDMSQDRMQGHEQLKTLSSAAAIWPMSSCT